MIVCGKEPFKAPAIAPLAIAVLGAKDVVGAITDMSLSG
jgi:hypothetical protein